MSREFSKNTSNLMQLGTNIIGPLIGSVSAVSMHCWAYADTLDTGAADNVLFQCGIGDFISSLNLNVTGSVSPKVLRVGGRSQAADSFQSANGTTEITAGNWFSLGGVLDFANDQVRVYVNGILETTGSVTFGASAYTHTTAAATTDRIGCASSTTPATNQQWDGKIAEFVIWKADILTAGFLALAQGKSPASVAALNTRICYWPLYGSYSPEVDLIKAKNATITGTIAQAVHPVVADSYRVPITIDNTAGAALTNYQVRVTLNSLNFHFLHSSTDGSDLRFYDDNGSALTFWIDTWDRGLASAQIWVKVSVGAATSKTITMTYGETLSTATDTAAMEYYNALGAAGDLTDLGSSFGTCTWSAVADAASPTGAAVDADISTANDAGRYKTLALPAEHAIELYVMDAGAGSVSAHAGALLNMVDTNNWLRGGSNPVASSKDVHMRENVATTLTNRDVSTLSDTAGLATSTYYRQLSIWKKKTVVTGGTSFSVNTAMGPYIQGICTDGTSLWISGGTAGTNLLGRYNMSGTLQDGGTVTPGVGESWGGMFYVNPDVYIVRFDSTTPATRVYKLTTPATPTSGVTLVATITANISTSANGIAWDGTYWLIGETSTSSNGVRVFVYDASWNYLTTIMTPQYGGATHTGIQDIALVGKLLYCTIHSGRIIVLEWDKATLTLQLVDVFDSTFSAPQGIEWDATNSRFYLGTRTSPTSSTDSTVTFITLSQDATARTASVQYRDLIKSASTSFWTQASPGTQASIGISAFRDARFAKMFARQHAVPEPLSTLGAETIVGTAPLAMHHNRMRRA